MELHGIVTLPVIPLRGIAVLPNEVMHCDIGRKKTLSAMEQALSGRAHSDSADREVVRTLLRRDDVRAMVGDLGVDLRRAESAVATLEGRDLQNTAARARAAHEMLSGGAQTIQISVVTLLLIIIIVILLAD